MEVIVKYLSAFLMSIPVSVMLAACDRVSTGGEHDESPLMLYRSDPHDLAGVYRTRDITIYFVSTMHGDETLLILDTDQGALIRRHSRGTNHEVSLYGDRAELILSLSSSNDVLANEAKVSGDESRWQMFLDSRGMAAMPVLSAALGDVGVQGDTHPASLPLHLLSMVSAREHAFGLVDGAVPREQLHTYRDMRQLTDPGVQTHRLTCELPEEGKSCYGMCGLGCMCWPWICGDCCYHAGCAAHDRACRSWLGFSHPLCGGLVVGLPWVVWWVTAHC